MINYKNFNIYSNGNKLVIHNTQTNEIKNKHVENDYQFTFKVLKTKIKAIDGIDGLLKFIKKCVDENFGTCWVDNIIKGM